MYYVKFSKKVELLVQSWVMEKIERYEEIFIPGAPLESSKYFVGREQELSDLRKALKRIGQHPIIIGNRGVGKTSLVHQTLNTLNNPRVFIGCSEHTTFQSFARELLTQMGFDSYEIESSREVEKKVNGQMKPFGIGINAEVRQINTIRRDEIGKIILDPWMIFNQIKRAQKDSIIVVDEYDAIPHERREFHSGIAYLMKHLADNAHSCNTRIIVVGIAQSAGDLLVEHESIERSVREIYLRTLRREDILDFLDEAEGELGFKFQENVKRSIAWCSNGYPYFVHLVGLECIDVMLSKNKEDRTVTEEHYYIAVKKAVDSAFRSILAKYKQAIDGIKQDQQLLIYELAVHNKESELSRLDLQQILIKKGKMDEKSFDHAWVPLQQEKKLLYVSRNTDKIRFVDPLMKPFLRGLFSSSNPRAYKDPKQPLLFHEPEQ